MRPSSSSQRHTSPATATGSGGLPPSGPPPRKLPRVLTCREIEALLVMTAHDREHHYRDRAIILTLWGTGCRVSELCAMRRRDLDLGARTVRVMGKGRRERLCFLPPRVVAAISLWGLRCDPCAQLFGLGRRGVYKMVRRVARRAGVDGVYPHAFRHTCATQLVDSGTDLRWVQAYLGHASIRSTQLYTHVATSALSEVAALHPMEKQCGSG